MLLLVASLVGVVVVVITILNLLKIFFKALQLFLEGSK